MSNTSPFQTLTDHTHSRKRQVFRGNRKTFFEGTDASHFVCHFTDDASSHCPAIAGKGVMNNRISEVLFSKLEEMNLPNHFVRRLNMREQLVRASEPFSFTVRLYNYADHTLSSLFPIPKGTRLPRAITDYSTKGQVQQPMGRDHILSFGWASDMELDEIQSFATRVNDILSGFFMGIGFRLVRLNLEFGRVFSPEFMDQCDIILIDDLTPDTFELQDLATGESLSLNLEEKDLATAAATYQHIAERLGALHAVNTPHMSSIFSPAP